MNIETTIQIAMRQLFEVADNHNEDGNDINTAIAEVEIKGNQYQIQVSLIRNKKLWCQETEVRFTSLVKLHE